MPPYHPALMHLDLERGLSGWWMSRTRLAALRALADRPSGDRSANTP